MDDVQMSRGQERVITSLLITLCLLFSAAVFYLGMAHEANNEACRDAFRAARTPADTLMVLRETDCSLPEKPDG